MSQTHQTLSVRDKLAYGAGDVASNLFWTSFGAFLMVFYTNVFGLPAATAGNMLLIVGFLVAFADPVMGAIADRTNTRWGRFRPWLLWMAVPFGLIGMFTFTTPDLGLTGKIVYACVTYFLMMLLYTAINIPYSALMGVLTSNSRERTVVSSYRFVCAFLSAAFVTGATPLLVDYLGRDNQAVVSAAIVNGGVELTERGTGTAKLVLTAEDRAGRRLSKVVYVKVNKAIQQPGEGLDQAADLAVDMVLAGVAAQQPGKVRLHSVKLDEGFSSRALDPAEVFDDYDAGKTVLSVRVISQAQGYQWTMTAYAVAAIVLFLATFFGTRERVRPDPRQRTSLKQDLADLVSNGPWIALVVVSFFKLIFLAIRTGSVVYYCKYFAGSEMLGGWLLMAGTLAQAAGVSLTKWLVARMGKRNTYTASISIGAALTLAFFFVRADQIVLIFVLHPLIMLALGPTSPIVWAMYADAADYSEWRTGRRATGMVFSAASFAQKSGNAIALGLQGLLMAWFGYKANVQQTDQSLLGILLMMSLIPAVFGLLAAVAMRFYNLDEQKMARIEAEVAQRKANPM